MNKAEIKDAYSMRDILSKCNIKIEKAGFCKCPFHKGDHTASLKVYEKGFYCFGCGKGGDFIKFVQLYQGLDFKAACKWITGEELTQKSKTQLAIEKIKRQEQERKQKRLQTELNKVNESFSGLWQKCQDTKPTDPEEPFSDEWCEAVNKWHKLCYQQETIIAELGEV